MNVCEPFNEDMVSIFFRVKETKQREMEAKWRAEEERRQRTEMRRRKLEELRMKRDELLRVRKTRSIHTRSGYIGSTIPKPPPVPEISDIYKADTLGGMDEGGMEELESLVIDTGMATVKVRTTLYFCFAFVFFFFL